MNRNGGQTNLAGHVAEVSQAAGAGDGGDLDPALDSLAHPDDQAEYFRASALSMLPLNKEK
jgi:hypothetical protein